MTVDWNRFGELIKSNQKFLLTSHVRPDCDALGSELGMAGLLESLGKEVRIVNGHPTPPNFKFIDPGNKIETINEHVTAAELLAFGFDVMMVLDTSAWVQLGDMADVLKNIEATKMVLDHHVGEDDLGAEFFKDTKAEAAGRLVYEAAKALNVDITPEMAMPLYAAIATDTGWFRFGSVNAGTYRCVADLQEAGAHPATIYGALYETDTLSRVQLRGRILERVALDLEGQLAYSFVNFADWEETGAHPSDTEDVINMALAIAGVQFAVIFIEQKPGGFKISFRSRCHVDCNAMARKFDGGGHKAAAGAFVHGTLAEVQGKVLDAVRVAMR